MLFSSITFLYYFLPAVLAVYFCVPRRLRNFVLLCASLLFYAWGEPKYVLLMAVEILLGYSFGRLMAADPRRKKLYLWLSCLTGLGMLAYFKYADFLIRSFSAVTGLDIPLLRIALPIGISFFTFQILSYTIDVYRGNIPAQKKLIDFAAYVAMFPQLIAGPIVRYTDVAPQLANRTVTLTDCHTGLRRFILGLAKKVLLANQLGQLCQIYQTAAPSVLFTWLYAISFTLHIYFDFSGYSDMAIGLGRMLGFRFPENFDYPYVSQSITEFWRRWHMTLGRWFRDYVYIPLGGNRVSIGRWLCNLLVVWALTGLWHGAAWNFVVWGLGFGLILILEKRWLQPLLDRLPRFIRHFYVMLLVLCSFVLFNAESLPRAAQQLGALFGFGGLPLYTTEALYYLRSYGLLLLLSVIGCLPLVKNLAVKQSDTAAARVLEPVVLILLLLLCTAYLVDGSFNPFLYFRF